MNLKAQKFFWSPNMPRTQHPAGVRAVPPPIVGEMAQLQDGDGWEPGSTVLIGACPDDGVGRRFRGLITSTEEWPSGHVITMDVGDAPITLQDFFASAS